MWLPPFDSQPTDREREKFMNSYWVRQLNNYKRQWDELTKLSKQIEDLQLFKKERTGQYPLWHVTGRTRDKFPYVQVVSTDSAPVKVWYNKDEYPDAKTWIKVDSSRKSTGVSFKDYLKDTIANTPRGFSASINTIKNPQWYNDKREYDRANIHERRVTNVNKAKEAKDA